MKIAYLCSDSDIPILGQHGCSVHIREFSNALVEAGHDVFILCASTGRGAGIRLKARSYEITPSGLDAIAWKSLETEPLIQGNRLERDLKSVLFNQSLKSEGGSIIQREKPDLLYERYSLFGWAGVELSRRFGIPLILEVNAPLCSEQAGYERFTLSETADRIETEVFRRADAIIAVSQWLKEWITAKGADARKVHVVPNGVSTSFFDESTYSQEIRSGYGLVGNRVIGYLGSFQPWHDVDGLLAAFRELNQCNPELRLLLVGDGPKRLEMETTVRKRGLQSVVIFTGNVAHEVVPSFIGAMDIAVVPYRMKKDFYFSPLKLFECMVAGRPTVAAALGQIEQIIEHGRTGWLYSPGDREELANGIAALLASSELASSIGEAGRQKVLSDFTWEATAARVTCLARMLIDSRGSVLAART